MSLSNACPRCGFHTSNTISPSHAMDDVSLLGEAIQQIEDTILRLKDEKAKLSNHLNKAQALTRSLPNEILSAVFEYASQLDHRPSEDFWFSTDNFTPCEDLFDRRAERYFSLYTLGRVCSDWRRITWSTSSLWTRLNLDVNEDRLVDHDYNLPYLYFENSRNKSMHVYVDCRKFQQARWTLFGQDTLNSEVLAQSPLGPLRDLIFNENAHRITHVLLNCPPPQWLPLFSEAFTVLEWIELSWPQSNNIFPHETISFANLPCLRRVGLRQIAVAIELPWEQITHLEIRDISIEVASRLIISCPNLVECDARGLNHPPPNDVDSWLPTERVTLHHLRVLKWEWRANDQNAILLNSLEFPALRYLYWSEEEADAEDYDLYEAPLSSFFRNLPAGQIELCLSRFDNLHSGDITIHLAIIFQNASQLKTLTLDGECNVLALIVRVMRVARREGSSLLPHLQMFCPSTRSYYGSMELLHDFITERRASGMAGIRLEMHRLSHDLEWTHAIKSSLRSMVRDGFKLEILENGEMVKWLQDDVLHS